MDLDNLKKDWQQTNLEAKVGDDKIRQMLDNEGQSAYGRLLKHEKQLFKLSIFCIPATILFYFVYSLELAIIYTILLVVGFFWQTYKVNFLKKVDICNTSLMDISLTIGKYRKILKVELILSFIITPILCYYIFRDIVSESAIMDAIERSSFIAIFMSFNLLILIVALVAAVYGIYSIYYKNINEIEKSIKEAKEYQKDNIN